MRRAPSLDALAMAGAEWAEVTRAGADDDGGGEAGAPPPPEHLRAFEAFLEEVVPADMVLAFGREEGERARRGERRRSRKEDVQEKLKLWAKAVARKTREQTSRRGGSSSACAVRIQCT
jgi:hypothetical protein